MEVLAVGQEWQLMRPCTECGRRTGRFCETMLQVGYAHWQGGICLAAERIPSESWAHNQRTPLCGPCETKYGACRFCRRVHGCTPPTRQ